VKKSPRNIGIHYIMIVPDSKSPRHTAERPDRRSIRPRLSSDHPWDGAIRRAAKWWASPG